MRTAYSPFLRFFFKNNVFTSLFLHLMRTLKIKVRYSLKPYKACSSGNCHISRLKSLENEQAVGDSLLAELLCPYSLSLRRINDIKLLFMPSV
jgi:hypothetical protein